jgi:hypothetical protein
MAMLRRRCSEVRVVGLAILLGGLAAAGGIIWSDSIDLG